MRGVFLALCSQSDFFFYGQSGKFPDAIPLGASDGKLSTAVVFFGERECGGWIRVGGRSVPRECIRASAGGSLANLSLHPI